MTLFTTNCLVLLVYILEKNIKCVAQNRLRTEPNSLEGVERQ